MVPLLIYNVPDSTRHFRVGLRMISQKDRSALTFSLMTLVMCQSFCHFGFCQKVTSNSHVVLQAYCHNPHPKSKYCVEFCKLSHFSALSYSSSRFSRLSRVPHFYTQPPIVFSWGPSSSRPLPSISPTLDFQSGC